MSHRIDLEDHLAHSLNSLRFSRNRWESKLFKGSGFYTNRLRRAEILAACSASGFSTEGTEVECWDSLPLPRSKIAAEFQRFSDDELCVRAMDLVAQPMPGRRGVGLDPSSGQDA